MRLSLLPAPQDYGHPWTCGHIPQSLGRPRCLLLVTWPQISLRLPLLRTLVTAPRVPPESLPSQNPQAHPLWEGPFPTTQVSGNEASTSPGAAAQPATHRKVWETSCGGNCSSALTLKPSVGETAAASQRTVQAGTAHRGECQRREGPFAREASAVLAGSLGGCSPRWGPVRSVQLTLTGRQVSRRMTERDRVPWTQTGQVVAALPGRGPGLPPVSGSRQLPGLPVSPYKSPTGWRHFHKEIYLKN